MCLREGDAVIFYVRYPVSYRDLQQILSERCICVDHATMNRAVDRDGQALDFMLTERRYLVAARRF